MNQFFSYMPKSGSRVIAAKSVLGLCLAYPRAGTIIAGDFIALVYAAAMPSLHWREKAKEMAKQIVESIGGLAEDAQGTITLCVPTVWAFAANERMKSIRPKAEYFSAEDATNESELWKGGILQIKAGSLDFERNQDFGVVETGRYAICPVRLPIPQEPKEGHAEMPYGVRFGLIDANGQWVKDCSTILKDRGHEIRVDATDAHVIHEHAANREIGTNRVSWFMPEVDECGDLVSPIANPAEFENLY